MSSAPLGLRPLPKNAQFCGATAAADGNSAAIADAGSLAAAADVALGTDAVCGDTSAFFATLLGMAVHNFRQPLQVILGSNELLLQHLNDTSQRDCLRRANRAAADLSDRLGILTEALQLQEISGGIRREPVTLAPILDDLGRELDGMARAGNLEFHLGRSRAVILSQKTLLTEILRNLARNALQYTPSGGRVAIRCRSFGNHIKIAVCDTGTGIPAEHLAAIFEAFQRIDSARTDGLGLGLFIVRKAASFLGHTIEVRSDLGRGSCFIVTAETAKPTRSSPATPVKPR
jgi:signal transduction histidine kinase